MEKIGDGSYGCVYHDPETGDAIKRCYHEKYENDQFSNIWAGNIREMDILRRCGHHPNIVGLTRVAFEKVKDPTYNKLTLYMEKFPTNLEQYVRSQSKGKVDTATLRIIAVQLLLGLEYLHTHKIVHRDLKPDNILIDPGLNRGLDPGDGAVGEVKSSPAPIRVAICDFGICDIAMKYRKSETKVTSPYYRAPEVFSEQQYSYDIDMWALGLILYYIIQGKNAYDYPQEEDRKISKEIQALKQSLDYIKDINEVFKINRHISSLKRTLNETILRSIEAMNIKRDFNPIHDFRSLILGLLQIDPKKRLTATQALALPFFNSVRATYIDPTRRNYPIESLQMRKLSFENIPERKWMSNYTFKFLSDYSSMNTDTIYPIVFHGLDLFERYIGYQREVGRAAGLSRSQSKGKYLNEAEVYLYLYTCFYIAHKYYAVTLIPFDYEDFFPSELLTDYNMEKAEEFEEFLLSQVIDFKFFEYTLYEITEEMINSPSGPDYFRILKEYLTVSQCDKNYNSYRSMYREHFFKSRSIVAY